MNEEMLIKIKFQCLLGIILLVGNFFILLYGVGTVFSQNLLGIIVTAIILQVLEIGAGFYTVESVAAKKILLGILSILFLLSVCGIEGYLAYKRTLLADKPEDLAILAGIISFLIPVVAALGLSKTYLFMADIKNGMAGTFSNIITGVKTAAGVGTGLLGATHIKVLTQLENALLFLLALTILPFDEIKKFFNKRKWW